MKPFQLLPLLLLSLLGCADATIPALTNTSGSLRCTLGLTAEGQPFYTLSYQGAIVLDTSYLGIRLEGADCTRNMEWGPVGEPSLKAARYSMTHGKQQTVRYTGQQYRAALRNAAGFELEVHFYLSEHGFAYRYYFPGAPQDSIRVLEEASAYGFPDSTLAWMQPMSKAKSGWKETNPSYEEHYLMGVPVSTPSPIGEGFVYPALFKAGAHWLLATEADLHPGYCGTRLRYDSLSRQMAVAFPQAEEVFPGGGLLPRGEAPFSSPWRILAIGSLGDIVESTIGTDLAAPSKGLGRDFVKSGLASWSWVLLKDDFTNYETSRRFIDYAAEMNWPYCLIDADWDWKIGYDRMQELIDYAGTKDLEILLWYNSSGSWNSTTYSPKSKLVDPESRQAEFARLQKMGVAGIKVDFFGGDGQSMIAYYHDILQDAASHQLMLNFHGATLPRGWHRTYPHLMTVEAIKGGEFITFLQENADQAPRHCAVIPFTRNVFDPMDFTPMVLDSIPGIQRRTTPAFELALPVLFTSGIQHIAEIPEGMQKMPAYVADYLRDIPTQWEEVKFLDGYPGEYAVLARRKGETWHIAGINGTDKEISVRLDLSFATGEQGVLLYDGPDGQIRKGEASAGPAVVRLPGNGGFVIKI
jgi:hypothetical protein